MDVSKAFDSVNHHQLLHKFHTLGICGKLLEWFDFYLSQRTQQVIYKEYISKSIQITFGVLQVSHLGSILFNIFINYITSIIC